MPVPASFTDISETASSNSPAGSETVGTQANEYFQAAFSFIRQLYDGVIKPLAPINVNGQQIINLAQGDTSSVSNQAVTGAQLRNFSYKIGEQRWWNSHGQAILPVWGPGWQLADGTNGTLDMRNRSPVGTGSQYGLGTTAGAIGVALAIANMPAHSHGVNDPGHAHGLADPGHSHGIGDPGHNHTVVDAGHSHGVNDPGHAHSVSGNNTQGGGAITFNGASGAPVSTNTTTNGTGISIALGGTGIHNNASLTGISLGTSGTGASVAGALTGISTASVGSGAGFDNRPPLMGVVCIEYTGIGA